MDTDDTDADLTMTRQGLGETIGLKRAEGTMWGLIREDKPLMIINRQIQGDGEWGRQGSTDTVTM